MRTKFWTLVALTVVLSVCLEAKADKPSKGNDTSEQTWSSGSDRLRVIESYYRRAGQAKSAEFNRVRAEQAEASKRIYVPIIKMEPSRRGEALRLTELLIKAIEQETPHKVVGTPEEADLILEATLKPSPR